MGVPKFYRWLSERYPLINQAVTPETRVECDNLYLDMNGIVHNCTHSDDDTLRLFLSHEQIFVNVFKYLDKLFKLVRPKKLLFMALDGVAPRAKMNQQRQRRFRTAAEAAIAYEEAKRKGEIVGDLKPFDSNQITPGTEFMKGLSDALKYFIRRKLKEDASWQRVKIVLSGAEVPGEGEHKLMLFIRNMKMQANYSPNLRHCLYGLDADLIFLALVAHEPHFFLLREEVIFGNRQGGSGKLPRKVLKNTDEFQLLHISLLRNYLDLEYLPLAGQFAWPGGYDKERLIDDWVFLAYLVGNDFLPHLPTLDIGEGGLDTLFELYKSSLAELGGYITDHGKLNASRLEVIFRKMGELEEAVFQKRVEETRSENRHERRQRAPVIEIGADEEFPVDDITDQSINQAISQSINELSLEEKAVMDADRPLIEPSPSPSPITAESPDSPIAELVIDPETDTGAALKSRYYTSKFPQFYDKSVAARFPEMFDTVPVPSNAEEHKRSLVQNYLEGLMWVQRYYYSGVPSWKWYFRYRYAPLASDMKDLASFNIQFNLGQPFRPLEQLLGVLPPASSHFLPGPYRELMSEDSKIADFYPLRFEVDMNGKRNSWEGIALIPFIEESRLLDAVKSVNGEQRLSVSEKLRNVRVGDEYLYEHDPTNNDTFPSPLASLPTLYECRSKVEVWQLPLISLNRNQTGMAASLAAVAATSCVTTNKSPEPSFPIDHEGRPLQEYEQEALLPPAVNGEFVPTVPRGCKEPYPGFPSLFALQSSASLRPVKINIFGTESRKDTCVLTLERGNAPASDLMSEAEAIVGSRVWIDWPYLREAELDSVSDGRQRFLSDGRVVDLRPVERDEHLHEARHSREKLLTSRGVDVGPITVLASVRPFVSMKREENGSISKLFATQHVVVPFQLVLAINNAPDPRWQEQEPPTLAATFPIGSPIVYTGPQHYGSVGKVVAHSNTKPGQQSVQIEITPLPPVMNVGTQIATGSKLQYYPSYMVARTLEISPLVLAKICASIFVNPGKFDIGLKLRFSKQGLVVPEYARRVEAWVDPSQRRPEQQGGGQGRMGGGSYDTAGDVGGTWEYSEKAIVLIATYKKRYPNVFNMIEQNPNEFKYNANMLLPQEDGGGVRPGEAQAVAHEISEWLKTVGITNLLLMPCSSKLMADRGVKALEAESAKIDAQFAKTPAQPVVLNDVSLLHIYPPSPAFAWSPTESVQHDLGDRIMSIRSDASVPLGMCGYIVAIHGRNCDIVFDKEFMTGTTLNGRCGPNRGQTLSVSAFLNLSKPRVVHIGRGAIGDAAGKQKARTILKGLNKQPQQQQQQQSQQSTPQKGKPAQTHVSPAKKAAYAGQAPAASAAPRSNPPAHAAAAALAKPAPAQTIRPITPVKPLSASPEVDQQASAALKAMLQMGGDNAAPTAASMFQPGPPQYQSQYQPHYQQTMQQPPQQQQQQQPSQPPVVPASPSQSAEGENNLDSRVARSKAKRVAMQAHSAAIQTTVQQLAFPPPQQFSSPSGNQRQ